MEIFQKTLINCEKMMEAILEHGSPKHIFITFEKIKKQLKIQSDSLKEFLKDNHDVEYVVNMDKRIKEVASIISLAEIQLKTKPFSGLSTLDIDATFSFTDEDTELQRQLRGANIAYVGAVKLWNVNTKGSWFTGGTFLGHGRLICTDKRNGSLNVFDKDGDLQFSHSLDYRPWDVTQHLNGRIFVTDQTTNSIRIYALQSKTFNELKTITLQFRPDGIKIVNEIIVAVIGEHIKMLTLDGKIIGDVKAVYNSRYVASSEISKKGSNFYYCEDKDVISKTVDGKEVHRLRSANIQDARGMSVDCAGNIYVCCKTSKNVIIVSEDFKSSRVFLSHLHVINDPFAIGFDKSGTRFFLSGWDDGTLAVYNLCIKK